MPTITPDAVTPDEFPNGNPSRDTGGGVLLGLSGGVDSAVAALLLKRSGHTVRTLYLLTDDSGAQAAEDAAQLARQLDLPFEVRDVRKTFAETVVTAFVRAYAAGRTPNPCVLCNAEIKFAGLLAAADEQGCRRIASGHYAAVQRHPVSGRIALRRGVAGVKDQTYFLYRLSQEQLQRLILPLAERSKDEVRALAASSGLRSSGGLSLAAKPDSQDICFLPAGDLFAWLENAIRRRDLPDERALLEAGPVLDAEGRLLGRHDGLLRYTFGQRKGFDVPTTERLYVLGTDPSRRVLIVGSRGQLRRRTVDLDDVVYSGAEVLLPGSRVLGRIRSSRQAAPATVAASGDDRLSLRFDAPVSAPAAGQSAVLLDEAGFVLAGGVIQGSAE